MKIKGKKITLCLLVVSMLVYALPICTMADQLQDNTDFAQNRIIINACTNNGSLDYIDFKDENGILIEDSNITISNKTINVVLPKNYDISGKIVTEFSLTQNSDGFPYVTTKNKASGSKSGRAWENRTNKITTTLSNGMAKQNFYFYNHKPTATTNTYDTYLINYSIKNEAPILSHGISAINNVKTEADVPYCVNLNEIFTDSDGDTLSYKVKIDETDEVIADPNYSFTPEIGGEYVLTFSAFDGKEKSTDTYTTVLSVSNSSVAYNSTVLIPEGVVPQFYITRGYDENNCDILGDMLSCDSGALSNGFIPFTVKIPENIDIISVRAKKDGLDIGGMSFSVYDGLSTAFKEVHGFIPTKASGKYVTQAQVKLEIEDAYGHYAACGESGYDNDGILYYNFFLDARGNESLYTFYAKPTGDISSVYALTQENNVAISPENSSIYRNSIKLSYKSAFELNVPSDADAKAFYQNKYYKVSELTPLEIQNKSDGTKSYFFHVSSGNDAYTYRVFKEGTITKAGYIKGNEKKVTWADSDYAPNSNIAYDKSTTLGSRGDDSILLNINSQNRLILENGKSFRLRAYRIWQIINNDTMNKIIEPDFTYDILSGKDIINITPVTKDNGNAKNNWLDITAISDGTAIVEISYDALDIVSGNASGFNSIGEFTFGACDEARKALVVIQTSDGASDVDFGIQTNGDDALSWDSEFDTVYFTGEYTKIKFLPSVSDGNIDKVEFSNDKGKTWTKTDKKDGFYTARIISGNNLLKVTKDDGTSSYQVVRGDKINVLISNITNPQKEIEAGDKVRITLDGVHFPLGKMAGIYNPGYAFGHRITYKNGEETVQTADKIQYDFPTKAYVDITVPDDAKTGDSIKLTEGYIYFNNMGSTPGEHRRITDDGVPVNMSASNLKYSRCILPDVTINIEDAATDNENDNNYSDDYTGDSGNTSSKPQSSIDVSNLKFDISGSEIKGYVNISFTDNGKRRTGESSIIYKNPLGDIIKKAKVPFKSHDSIASVTLRLLDALKIKASHSGNDTSNFYLLSIGNFNLNGKYYPSFGEFDCGASSGWMVKQNNWFINMGASEFEVEDGDNIEWLYTCQLGSDIGCDPSNTSAEITGIRFKANYGKLYPEFNKNITEYTYTIPYYTNSLCLEAIQENYWAKLSYKADNKTYKAMEAIPVADGTVISLDCVFVKSPGSSPIDTDSIKITIKKENAANSVTGQGTYNNKADDSQKDNEIITDNKEQATLPETIFTDIKTDDWHYEYVKYVYDNNLMKGTERGFEPESKMTRAMLVTVLYRMASPQTTSEIYNFDDVPYGEWYSDAVAWAAENKIINGISEKSFAPNEDVSREQMAVIIYRYAKMQGYDTKGSSDISDFEDKNNISDWAIDAIKWTNSAKLINGTSDKNLSPKDTATRAQVAAILTRFCENIMK